LTDNAEIRQALEQSGTIDITTTGAKSGEARRLEIVFFPIDGRIYISGTPGRRAWIANLNADPHMTVHLKKGITADLLATARVISDPEERLPVLTVVTAAWKRQAQLQAFLDDAPLIEVTLDDASLMRSSANGS
jgi:deazaflavin-dependent oxidoreductase (nitroreductase family)